MQMFMSSIYRGSITPHCASAACPCSRTAAVSSKSSGKSANRSNARTVVPSFSRKMISSPRRKISASSLFNLKCFGSRAAGLFPDLNTRAVRRVHRRKPYLKYVQRRMKSQNDQRLLCLSGSLPRQRLAVPNTRYFCCKDQGLVNPPSAWRCIRRGRQLQFSGLCLSGLSLSTGRHRVLRPAPSAYGRCRPTCRWWADK